MVDKNLNITQEELDDITSKYIIIRNIHMKKRYGFQLSILRSSFIHKLDVTWAGILGTAVSMLVDIISDKYVFEDISEKKDAIKACYSLINIAHERVLKIYE